MTGWRARVVGVSAWAQPDDVACVVRVVRVRQRWGRLGSGDVVEWSAGRGPLWPGGGSESRLT